MGVRLILKKFAFAPPKESTGAATFAPFYTHLYASTSV